MPSFTSLPHTGFAQVCCSLCWTCDPACLPFGTQPLHPLDLPSTATSHRPAHHALLTDAECLCPSSKSWTQRRCIASPWLTAFICSTQVVVGIDEALKPPCWEMCTRFLWSEKKGTNTPKHCETVIGLSSSSPSSKYHTSLMVAVYAIAIVFLKACKTWTEYSG